MRKILEQCPTCESPLLATELSCSHCETVIHGRYSPCPFCSLSAEDVAFLLVFVKTRGNVKEMERELGVSYWTIRNRLNQVVERLGFTDLIEDTAATRREVLERLDRQEIGVDEAAELLAQLR